MRHVLRGTPCPSWETDDFPAMLNAGTLTSRKDITLLPGSTVSRPLSFLSLDCPGHSHDPSSDKRISILVASLKPLPLRRSLFGDVAWYLLWVQQASPSGQHSLPHQKDHLPPSGHFPLAHRWSAPSSWVFTSLGTGVSLVLENRRPFVPYTH